MRREKIFDRLDSLYFKSQKYEFPKGTKFLFISDLHMGDGSPADDFIRNAARFLTVKKYKAGWTIFCVGDAYDLWQFKWGEIFKMYGLDVSVADYYVEGNHDKERKFDETITIYIEGWPEIFVIHGHQAGDIFSYELWKVGRWFTRYIWKPLEYLGLKDPPSSKSAIRHDPSRQNLKAWANLREINVVAGHTHWQEEDRFYRNIGCQTVPGTINFIEFDSENGKFTLVEKNL